MEQRIVNLQIKNEYIIGSGVSVGAVGSHDDVLLEMDFRGSFYWAGTTRRAIFSNALGESRTPIILGTDLLEEGQSEVYLVPVPQEAKDVAGECFLTVEGFVTDADGKEIIRCVTEEARFRVLPSKMYTNDSDPVTPSQAEQLQAEINEIKQTIVDVTNSKAYSAEKAELAGAHALTSESWAVGQRDGKAVEETDPAYQNNAKWWSGIAEAAKSAALAAKESAESVLASLVETANEKIAAAAQEVTNAKSWAVGGTGTRTGEDTNNAKYWSEQAAAAAGGGVMSFNGRNGAVVPQAGDYNAKQVGAIPSSEKGAASGVATLGADGKVPSGQLPSLDYVPNSEKGAASGVATLGTDGKVPTGQLPEISSVKTYTAIIGTTWTENEDTGVKSQSVPITGVLAKHTAKVDHAYTGDGTSDGYAAFVEAENQYLTYITNGYAETYDGGITFYIFGDAPTVSIPIVVEVA